MIRIVFLIALFIFNLWGLYKYIRIRIAPSDAIKALKELGDKEGCSTAVFMTVVISTTYIIVLTLNALIVPSEFLTVALVICAALELVVMFRRINKPINLYSSENKVQKYLKSLKSFSSFIGFVWNIAETGIIGAAIYIILKELA